MWDRWFRQWIDMVFWWRLRTDRAEDERRETEAEPPEVGHNDAHDIDRPSAEMAEQVEKAPPAPAPDDLTTIKGIGPAMQRELEALGLTTFDDLANADAEALTDKLKPSQRTLTTDKVKAWIEAARSRH
jgi:predicted flap endonuclease-1-like 5' DNA nuclease